jgi:hypothetical protein
VRTRASLHRVAAAVFLAGAVACASSKGGAATGKRPDEHGSKLLTAVVTEREYSSPGSRTGGSYAGSGAWYLGFEAEEGDRTVHYRFPVTRNQYFRYPEGTRVQLVLLDDQLREIRPVSDR